MDVHITVVKFKEIVLFYFMSLIRELENIIPSDICKKIIINYEKSNEKHEGKTTRGFDQSLKKCMDLHIDPNNKVWEKLHRYVSDKLLEQVICYIQYLSSDVYNFDNMQDFLNIFGDYFGKELRLSGLQMQRYKPGDYFKPHIDSGGINDTRLFALILYLHSLDETQGGETRFYNGEEIKPKEGKLLIFPATWTYMHEGKPVKEGYKYIITSFVHVT